MEELASTRIVFSHWPVVQAIFLELCIHFFIAIRVA